MKSEILRQNQLSEVCHDVRLKPQLKPLTGKMYDYSAANTTDNSRTDVSVQEFWVLGQLMFSDIRVFNPIVKYYSAKYSRSFFTTHERGIKEASIRESLRQKMAPLLR